MGISVHVYPCLWSNPKTLHRFGSGCQCHPRYLFGDVKQGIRALPEAPLHQRRLRSPQQPFELVGDAAKLAARAPKPGAVDAGAGPGRYEARSEEIFIRKRWDRIMVWDNGMVYEWDFNIMG